MFFKFANLAGWDGGQQIDVLLQFVENHCDDESFREHLQDESGGAAGAVDGFDETVAVTGWCGAEQIDVLLEFIENQGSDEAFRAHLFESAQGQVVACEGCGDVLAPKSVIDCPDCGLEFCSKCYDASRGEGCQCHPEILFCHKCGQKMEISSSGVSHHVAMGGGVDYDADADHVAFYLEGE